MRIREWDNLPSDMKNLGVMKYYIRLKKKKASLFFKRVFDVFVAFIMLVLLSPIFLVLSIAIRAGSKGPVFFRQERVTQYGRRFRIFKFRTMVDGADNKGAAVTTAGDSRITKVGSFIRKCRLDEIPQLLNVLGGSMSFVGVRPEVPKYVERYTDEMKATLLLPAGITSPASIKYKDEDEILSGAEDPDEAYVETVLPAKMEYNYAYLNKCGFFRDIGTMFATVFAVLRK